MITSATISIIIVAAIIPIARISITDIITVTISIRRRHEMSSASVVVDLNYLQRNLQA